LQLFALFSIRDTRGIAMNAAKLMTIISWQIKFFLFLIH